MPAPNWSTDPPVVDLVTGWFDEGPSYRTYRPRGSNSWLMIYTTQGRGWAGSVGHRLNLTPGDLILYRPGAPQEYGTASESGRWGLLWAHFHPRPHWGRWLRWPEAIPGLLHLTFPADDTRERFEHRFIEVHRQAGRSDPESLAFAMNGLEELLIRAQSRVGMASNAGDPRLTMVLDYIATRLPDLISLEELAAVASLSPSRLAHFFREQLGVPPRAFIERQRIERAANMLRMTDLPVQTIADQTGFPNAFYFASRFRKLTGQTPTSYRAAQRSDR